MNIESIRKYCLSLPGTVEDIKWGADLCFTIATKMYCVSGMDGALKVSFKCSDEDFEMLSERDGIIPAPYMARNKWVMVENAGALSKAEWLDYIYKSYVLIGSKLPKKAQQELKLKLW
ncbi:MAG TPA: MmcQ/YjbR family DNA-binding protein [Segetibacter sp.]